MFSNWLDAANWSTLVALVIFAVLAWRAHKQQWDQGRNCFLLAMVVVAFAWGMLVMPLMVSRYRRAQQEFQPD